MDPAGPPSDGSAAGGAIRGRILGRFRDRRTAKVIMFDTHSNAATVRAVMHGRIDCMRLPIIRGEWKIVNVLWEPTPDAKKQRGFAEEL